MSYAASGVQVVANLDAPAANAGDAVGHSYSSIEALRGTQYGDTLMGDANSNRLNGGGGDDALWGMGGGDFLNGEDGDDHLFGSLNRSGNLGDPLV